ncbi:hypothetical protein AX774_g958 [Zancudomyces culisetae]|uniref:Uncharacterized protein n=1 Tax=Zancudomyces culisetae TaxID=1213189 RepID=A0A1R1PWY3_ZANCU|nr:hypothetical protein AX774_g958 [Zancudomyces culisetae]|eukprot:OMH85468.1 hypothetical protein AX774_g958 [Zancudomyces culisetae]
MTNGCDHSQVNEVVEKPVEGIYQFYRCIAIYGVKKFEDIQNKRECVCTPEGRVCYPVDDTPSGPEDENSILENPKIEGLMEKYKMCVLQSGNNFFHGGDRCSLCLCTFGGRKCLDVSCELLEEIDLDRDVHKKKGTVLESNTSTLRTHIYT